MLPKASFKPLICC